MYYHQKKFIDLLENEIELLNHFIEISEKAGDPVKLVEIMKLRVHDLNELLFNAEINIS